MSSPTTCIRCRCCIEQVHSFVKTCVATGGGIVSEKKNWGKLQTGMVVWLDMEVRTKKEG